ncbi:MAG TPA: hypothetical protein VHN79_12275 [Lacunisphaera sp.]|nr:hypothetical protein [Lacunisphaera sp.]
MKTPPFFRRHFLKTASLASTALAFPAILRAQSPNNKLNLALIGVGHRGWSAVQNLKGENYVAFCDVDDELAARAYQEFPGVPRFRDNRKMLDQLGNRIDAVVVSTPLHRKTITIQRIPLTPNS